TAVMHELGHELGLADIPLATDSHALMTESIATGVRRLPPASPQVLATPSVFGSPRPLGPVAATPTESHAMATDSIFAILGRDDHNLALPHAAVTGSNNSGNQMFAIPSRVEAQLAALQPMVTTPPGSMNIGAGTPRKSTVSVDAVFELLGR